jgi:hypothetical protein
VSEPITREQLEQGLKAQRREILEGVAEIVRDAQTEILKAFFPFQESTALRFRKLEADSSEPQCQLG